MKMWKRITDGLLVVFLLLAAAIAVPQVFGIRVYTVLSPSMGPEIPVGSAVYVKKEAFEKIRPGDIITCRPDMGDIYITHRVSEKDEAGRTLVTKGDANETPDGRRVREEELMGVVRLSVPYLGYAAMLFSGMGEKLLLAGVFLWLLLIKMILSNVLKMRKEGVTIS